VSWIARIEHLPSLVATGPAPRNFIRRATGWIEVCAAATNPEDMSALADRTDDFPPWAPPQKLWAEAVYEETRRAVLPDAPSRLDCLFATELGDDAFAVMPELGRPLGTFDESGLPMSGQMVVPARTSGAWVALDMHLFQMPEYLVGNVAALSNALERLQELATRYWSGDVGDNPVVELLCERLHVEGWGK
jgi:hypothetical protein